MKNLKIALLQIAPGGSLEENLGKRGWQPAGRPGMGADIALFPEMWSSGYRIYNRPASEWQAEAVSADRDFSGSLWPVGRRAFDGDWSDASGKGGGGPKNTLVFFDRHGNREFTYSKVHTCDFDVERHLTPGEDFYVTTLDTACGPVQGGSHDLF